jgi:AcrR family transcriptional regulator
MVQVLNPGLNNVGSQRVRRKYEARQFEILRAAARVFRRRGVAAAGMREIAEEADLSPGNLYHYFSGKHEILLFCQERKLEHMLAAVKAARASAVPVAEQLRAVMRVHVHCMLDDLEGATAHLEVEALPEALRGPMIEKRDAYERAVRTLVAQGMKRGEFANNFTRGAFFLGLEKGVAMLSTLLYTALMARWLGPHNYGMLTVAFSVVLHGLSAGPLAAWFARRSTDPAAARG